MGSRLLVLLAVFAVIIATPAVVKPTSAASPTAPAVETATTTVFLPNITRMLGGPTGWQTPFIVQNIGNVPTDLDIRFYQFSDGSLVADRHVSGLAPGTSFADVPNNDADLPAGGQFSVVVQSFGAPIVSVVNEHQGVGERAEALSYVGLSAGATSISLPYIAKDDGGWLTTFIIQNLGSAPTIATIKIGQSVAGAVTWSTTSRSIAPGRSAAIDPRIEPSIQAGSNMATITADQPIGVVANVHNDAAGVLNPKAHSYNGVMNPGSPTYLPYVAKNVDGVGRSTTLYIQNAGSAPATPRVELHAGGAIAETIASPLAIAPGERYVIDLMTDTVSAAGEYAAVVSGGTFAVLAATTSPGTAHGYTGQGHAGSKLFLPNVTRTLGGPAGWTTPIVVQSVTATGGTLRWHRFSDGGLVYAQPVSLTPGGSLKVDPRGVTPLTDNTQYAVVVETTGGTAVAVVVELAEGGDNAMAYEGFLPVGAAAPVLVPSVIATVKVGVRPGGIAINSVTNRVYVVNEGGDGISVIDGSTDAVVGTIAYTTALPATPAEATPVAMAVNATTNRLYVVDKVSNVVAVFDGATNKSLGNINVGQAPLGIAVNTATNRIYVANSGGSVSVIDGGTSKVVASVPITGGMPVSVTVNEGSNRIYVASRGGTTLALASPTLTVIDGTTNMIVSSVQLSGGAVGGYGVAFNAGPNRVYVNGTEAVTVIDTAANRIVGTIPVPQSPWGIGLDPGANRLYVVGDTYKAVTVIDVGANTVVGTVDLPNLASPRGVAVNPTSGLAYTSNYGTNNVSVIR